MIGTLSPKSYILKTIVIPESVDRKDISSYLVTNVADLFPLPKAWNPGTCWIYEFNQDSKGRHCLAWISEARISRKTREQKIPLSLLMIIRSFVKREKSNFSRQTTIVAFTDGIGEIISFLEKEITIQRFNSLDATKKYCGQYLENADVICNNEELLSSCSQAKHFSDSLPPIRRMEKKYFLTISFSRFGIKKKGRVFVNILNIALLVSIALGVFQMYSYRMDHFETHIQELNNAIQRRTLVLQQQEAVLVQAESILNSTREKRVQYPILSRLQTISRSISSTDLITSISIQGDLVLFSGIFIDPLKVLSNIRDESYVDSVELLQSRPAEEKGYFSSSFKGVFSQ